MELADLMKFANELKGSGTWDVQALIRVGGSLAGRVNALQNLSGGEKLKLVQQILRRVLEEAESKETAVTGLTKEQIEAVKERFARVKAAVEDVLPASLELAVQASRGKLNLKKIKPSVWVKFCSCFLKTVVQQLASHHLISEAQASQASHALEVVQKKAEEAAAASEGAGTGMSSSDDAAAVAVSEAPAAEAAAPASAESATSEVKAEETQTAAPAEPSTSQ